MKKIFSLSTFPRHLLSCIDVTALLSPVFPRFIPLNGSEISRFCMSQSRGKIGKLIGILFSIIIQQQHEDLIKQIKNSVIYTLTELPFEQTFFTVIDVDHLKKTSTLEIN